MYRCKCSSAKLQDEIPYEIYNDFLFTKTHKQLIYSIIKKQSVKKNITRI